ncbi:MAG: carbohydrate kinase family protein [Candidatus Nanopelagicales bacterium]|jgi:sugar/nucleoside kinase (ribokinase family)|nr:carbohydrate kinase family protein [Candidatus Nanopelagicales bacterium]
MSSTEASPARGTICVVGNPGLDTLVLLGEDAPDLDADGHFVRNVDTPGHAAFYAALTLATLGHAVRVLGSVGDDIAGTMVRAALGAAGVDTTTLFIDPAGTARSVNLVRPDGRRTFFFDGAGHMTLHPPADAVRAALDGADLVLSALPNWGREVLVAARGAGIPIAVDLQDARSLTDPYRADFVAAAQHLFASAAHLPDPRAAARAWCAAGPARTVVFGLGARGALLAERAAPDGSPTGELRLLEQPPPGLDLPVVDTTGCGDALAVGFLDGLLEGLPAAAALHRGQLAARLRASGVGASVVVDRATLAQAAALAPTSP